MSYGVIPYTWGRVGSGSGVLTCSFPGIPSNVCPDPSERFWIRGRMGSQSINWFPDATSGVKLFFRIWAGSDSGTAYFFVNPSALFTSGVYTITWNNGSWSLIKTRYIGPGTQTTPIGSGSSGSTIQNSTNNDGADLPVPLSAFPTYIPDCLMPVSGFTNQCTGGTDIEPRSQLDISTSSTYGGYMVDWITANSYLSGGLIPDPPENPLGGGRIRGQSLTWKAEHTGSTPRQDIYFDIAVGANVTVPPIEQFQDVVMYNPNNFPVLFCYVVEGTQSCVPVPPGANTVTIPYSDIGWPAPPSINISIHLPPATGDPWNIPPPVWDDVIFPTPPELGDPEPFIITIPILTIPDPDDPDAPDPDPNGGLDPNGGDPTTNRNSSACIARRCTTPYIYRNSLQREIFLTDFDKKLLTTEDGKRILV